MSGMAQRTIEKGGETNPATASLLIGTRYNAGHEELA
jgi:hypothetical protein